MRAMLILLCGCWTSSHPAAPSSSTSDAEVLVQLPGPQGINGPNDLVVVGDQLYFTQRGDQAGIYVAPVARGAVPHLLIAHEDPRGLIAIGDRLYWESELAIYSAPLAGGDPQLLIQPEDMTWSLADAGGLVYGTYSSGEESTSSLHRFSAGRSTPIATHLVGATPTVRVEGGELFVVTQGQFAHESEGIIGRQRGKGVEVLARRGGIALAIDRDTVYFLGRDENEVAERMFQVPRAGGPVALTVKPQHEQGSMTEVAVDDRYVYWAEYVIGGGGAVWRRTKSGGTPERLGEVWETTRLVIHGPYLYWADPRLNRITRIKR